MPPWTLSAVLLGILMFAMLIVLVYGIERI